MADKPVTMVPETPPGVVVVVDRADVLRRLGQVERRLREMERLVGLLEVEAKRGRMS